MPKTIQEINEDGKYIQFRIPIALHTDLKKASRLDRRTMVAFTITAIEERCAKFLSEDIDSRDFVPEGLRKR